MKSPLKKDNKKPFTLYKSKIKTKKWDVYIPTKTGRLKKVSYGAAGMSDYTKHKDKERRENYRKRHKNDRINELFTFSKDWYKYKDYPFHDWND